MRREKFNGEEAPMMKDGKEVCPCCDRHCPKEQLHCSRGKEHFGLPVEEKDKKGHHGPRMMDDANMTTEEKVLAYLRGCGHYLHHNVGRGELDTASFLGFLTEEEKQQLSTLLKKCLEEWQNQKAD